MGLPLAFDQLAEKVKESGVAAVADVVDVPQA